MGIDFENPDWETNTKSTSSYKTIKKTGIKTITNNSGN